MPSKRFNLNEQSLGASIIDSFTRMYDTVWFIKDLEAEEFELFRADENTVQVSVAQTAVKLTKFTDAIKYYSNLIMEEDRKKFLEATTKENIIKNTEKKFVYSVQYRRVFDSTVRYFQMDLVKLDLFDKKISLIGGFKDVDEEVRKEQKIQQTLYLRSAVIEALTKTYDSIWLINDIKTQSFELLRINEKTVPVSPAYKATKFAKFSEALIYYANLIYEEDRQVFLDAVTIDNIIKNTENMPIYSVQFRRMFENEMRYYRAEFSKMNLENSETKIVVGFKNVDNEVRKDKNIQQTLNLRSSVIEALTRVYDSVWIINNFETQEFELMRLTTKDEVLSVAYTSAKILKFYDALKYYSNLVLEEDRQKFLEDTLPEKIIEKTNKQLLYSIRYRRVFKTGVRYYLLEFSKFNLENGESRVIGAFRDVDYEVRKDLQIQQALQEAIDVANASNKAKSDFLSSMSHDMRTPMNGIIGMTAIAANNLDNRDKVEDCLKKISDSSNHLLSLINEVLDMNKIESGKMELMEEEFDIAELIDNMLSMTKSQILAHKHTFFFNILSIEHEQVVGDCRRIQQVFVNIMSNAIKYTPNGGKITLTVQESPTKTVDFSHYQFIFEDNGFGMTEEFQKHLFEPFARANDKQTVGLYGTGLGMAITRNIIRAMGGDITVESVYGKGSKFTVNLYLKLQNIKHINYDKFVDLRVLVVDYDPVYCESTCEMLNDMEMNSEWVLSGKAAVERVNTRKNQGRDFFAIIIEWKMPNQDGIETIRQIRKLVGDKVHIVIYSSYDWIEIEQEARKAGVNSFISKPLFKTKLANLFNSFVINQSAESNLKTPMQKLEEMNLKGHRVLLAEDQMINAEIAMNFLGMTGLEVDLAKDGSEAVEKFAKSSNGYYSMIIMDIQMPVMNGYEATQKIRAMDRADAKNIPIVAMSANAFNEDVLNSKKVGMNDHIAKPIDFDALARVLENYVK